MAKVFEDEFMDIQSQIISLCLELVGSKVSKVYAYGSIEESSVSFNAFFCIGGKIKTTNDIVANTEAIWEFLDLGESDLEKIKELCKKYKRVAPTELKMIYDCDSGRFDCQYKYDSICSAKTGIDSSDIFMNWFNEIRQCL
jgi:hypothetical protein